MTARASRTKEQRWRRKRAVSPIIATILLVAITVVLAAVLYVLIAGLIHGPGNTPIGSALSVGSGTLVTGTSGTFGAASPCTSGDHCYTISIASASTGVTLGSVNFQVVSGGSVVPGVVGVAITNIAGTVVAYGTTGAITSLTYTAPSSATTALSTTDTIWVDMGTSNPTDMGDSLTIFGIGSYSGSTSSMLP